jgi:hypothetical protein
MCLTGTLEIYPTEGVANVALESPNGGMRILAVADSDNGGTCTLPNKSGTLALTSDIPKVVDELDSDDNVVLSQKAVKSIVGDINTLLDKINGEVL